MATSTSMTSTVSSPTHSPTHASNPDDTGGGKPLLFFVALGFGVVFTNLWIIVGVKYCFRFNQRGRQAIDSETGEPIDMANMQRPRRKREKKLMTMDEVNERFPLTKYKMWRAAREQEGLPAAGGVTAPPSRAASIKEAMLERTSTEAEASHVEDVADQSTSSAAPPRLDGSSQAQNFATTSTSQTPQQPSEKLPIIDTSSHDKDKKTTTVTTEPASASTSGSAPSTPAAAITTFAPSDTETPAASRAEADEEDPISTALPAALADATPGDACAICIDTLDDEDEVRGLTCGHAFHAGCLDPWLTSRRACCPLCKADYFVPKPSRNATNADGSNATSSGNGDDADGNDNNNNNEDGNNADGQGQASTQNQSPIAQPTSVWLGRRHVPFGSRIILGGRRYSVEPAENNSSVPGFRMDSVLHRSERRVIERERARREREEQVESESRQNSSSEDQQAASGAQEGSSDADAEAAQPESSSRTARWFGSVPNRFRRPGAASPSSTRPAAADRDLEANRDANRDVDP